MWIKLFLPLFQSKQKEDIFNLTVQYLENTVVQYNSWCTGAAIEWIGNKSYWLEEGEEAGDGKLKNCQQQETEGKLQFHSCLILTECTFTSLEVHNLKAHM